MWAGVFNIFTEKMCCRQEARSSKPATSTTCPTKSPNGTRTWTSPEMPRGRGGRTNTRVVAGGSEVCCCLMPLATIFEWPNFHATSSQAKHYTTQRKHDKAHNCSKSRSDIVKAIPHNTWLRQGGNSLQKLQLPAGFPADGK